MENPIIDSAMADLADLDTLPLDQQLNKLSTVQELLAQVLEGSRADSGVQVSIPGINTKNK